MRLIDADALSDLLVKTYEKAPTEKALLFVALLLKNNEQVPTFEERPHGEWIVDKLTRDVICSNCRQSRRDTRTTHIFFCNHCGADMRKGDET